MQVFYVNIGGGEPTVRPDFWELVDYATAHHVGREVLHQRRAHHPRGGRQAGRQRLRRRADLARRRHRRGQRRGARPRLVRDGHPRAGEPRRRRASRTPRSRSWSPATTSTSSTTSRRSADALRRHPAHHPAASVGSRRRRVGRTAPDRRAAGAALRLAGRPRRAACSPATRSSTCPASVSRARSPA